MLIQPSTGEEHSGLHVSSAQETQVKPTAMEQANCVTTAVVRCTPPFVSSRASSCHWPRISFLRGAERQDRRTLSPPRSPVMQGILPRGIQGILQPHLHLSLNLLPYPISFLPLLIMLHISLMKHLIWIPYLVCGSSSLHGLPRSVWGGVPPFYQVIFYTIQVITQSIWLHNGTFPSRSCYMGTGKGRDQIF